MICDARPARPDIDLELLKNTRTYLCRLRGATPQPQLTEAWERFYHDCDPLIRRFAIACGVSPGELDDFGQDIWKELITKLRSFDYDPRRGRFQSWLYCQVHRRAIDAARRRQRHPTGPLTPFVESSAISSDLDPAEICDRKLESDAVHCLLSELRHGVSKCTYLALHMLWIEGRTVTETAAALHLTPRQVSFRNHRAKRKVRQFLSDGRPSDGLTGQVRQSRNVG